MRKYNIRPIMPRELSLANLSRYGMIRSLQLPGGPAILDRVGQLLIAMMERKEKDVKRIQHFLRVYAFARLIGLVEADLLVDLFARGHPADTQREAYRHIFKTEGGKKLFRAMFAWE